MNDNKKKQYYSFAPDGGIPHRLIFFFRGGYGSFGDLNDEKVLTIIHPLVKTGFEVKALDYVDDEYGGKEGKALINFILDQESPFGFLGFSRGAMNALQILKAGVTRPSCAAFIGGMYDARNTKDERPDLWKMWEDKTLFNVNDSKELDNRSAVVFAKELPNIPYLLLHARNDPRISVNQALRMKEVLPKADLRLFNGASHSLANHKDDRDKILREFFSKYIKDQPRASL